MPGWAEWTCVRAERKAWRVRGDGCRQCRPAEPESREGGAKTDLELIWTWSLHTDFLTILNSYAIIGQPSGAQTWTSRFLIFLIKKKLTPYSCKIYRGTKTFSRNISVDFTQKYNRNTLKKDKTHWQDIWGSSFDIGCRALQKLLHRTAKVRSSRDVWDRSELVPRLRFELPFWGERWPWLVRELDAEKPLWFLWPETEKNLNNDSK